MATVTRENIGLLNEKITVTVAKDDYLPSFEKAIKSYSKKANIPGFRKGMVPVSMVKKMYGSSVFADEVLKSVEKGLQDYMTSEKLDIFAQPLPLSEASPSNLDMNQPSEYVFAFEVGLKPDVSIPDLATLSLTRYNVEITDAMVDEQVTMYLKNYGSRTDLEEISSEDDEVSLELSEMDSEGNVSEGSAPKNASALLKEFLPAAQEQLRGKKISDQLSLSLAQLFEGERLNSLLNEFNLTEADKDKTFQATIASISRQENATYNDELYQKAFPDKDINSEEGFRQEVKDMLVKQWDQQSVNQLQDQIYHALLDTPIAFPEEFLKKWMLTQGNDGRTNEEIENEFPKFTNSLKWNLITDKIITENNLQVQSADLRKAAADQLLGYMGGQVDITQPWITEYLDRMMKDKKYVQDLHQRVMIDKVFDWATTQVHPTDATISEEAFTKMVSEHKH